MNTTATARIAIIGTEVVTNEAEALNAAKEHLAWFGNSEVDHSPLEVEVSAEWDAENESESGRFEVRECWGEKVNRDFGEGEVVSIHATEAEAEAAAAKHNDAAVESIVNSATWFDLPVEPDSVWFPGCTHGQYPQSRRATVSVHIGGVEIEATGYGQVRFIRDTHCHAAVESALEKVCAAIHAATKGYYAARQNEVLAGMPRADVVALCRAVKNPA